MPAAIPIVAAVAGSLISNRGSKKAAEAQADSAREASASTLAAQREAQAYQQAQADQARKDQEPWRLAGIGALNKLNGMPNFTGASVGTDPGYQFGLREGMKGLTNSAAARGSLLSGAALKAASQYNSDYATTKFDAAFQRDSQNKNRLATLAGIGQTSASQIGQNAMTLGGNVGAGMMNAGNQVGQNMMGAGNARASGYLAQGNQLAGLLNQGVSQWNQYQNNQTASNAAGTPFQSNSTWINNNGGGF